MRLMRILRGGLVGFISIVLSRKDPRLVGNGIVSFALVAFYLDLTHAFSISLVLSFRKPSLVGCGSQGQARALAQHSEKGLAVFRRG